MFVGAIGCGKTTLIQRMGDMHIRYNKTQAIEFYDNIIDTPGEYVEHRELYSGLRTTSTGAKLVVLMQSAVDPRIVLPAGFSTMFTLWLPFSCGHSPLQHHLLKRSPFH